MKTTEELYRIQEEIASKAIIEDKLNPKIKLIAGADQAFFYGSKNAKDRQEKIISAVVVLEYPSMRLVNYSYSVLPVDFPYIPGLLSFREAPAIINAFHALENTTKPDLLVIDGCGVNHPRFAGLATHVGVVLDVATVGVAKNLLCGSGEVPMKEGEARMIKYKGKEIGYYLKSKKGCRPIIIAPGHKISLQSSLRLIRNCICKHKLPEPTRIAHLYANTIKKELE